MMALVTYIQGCLPVRSGFVFATPHLCHKHQALNVAVANLYLMGFIRLYIGHLYEVSGTLILLFKFPEIIQY